MSRPTRNPVFLETVFENDLIRIAKAMSRQRDGKEFQSDAIIAFSGIGSGVHANQKDEFVGTASEKERMAFFVTDKLRSWFNAPLLYETVVGILLPLIRETNNIVTVGNSMGGTGALLFASALNAKTALAIGPQASVSKNVIPTEHRWRNFVSQINAYRFEDINDFLQDGPRYVVLHGTKGPDQRQAKAFVPRSNLFRYTFPEQQHDLALHLKEQGTISALLEASLSGDMARIGMLLSDIGGERA